jgi:hypothetical protein
MAQLLVCYCFYFAQQPAMLSKCGKGSIELSQKPTVISYHQRKLQRSVYKSQRLQLRLKHSV